MKSKSRQCPNNQGAMHRACIKITPDQKQKWLAIPWQILPGLQNKVTRLVTPLFLLRQTPAWISFFTASKRTWLCEYDSLYFQYIKKEKSGNPVGVKNRYHVSFRKIPVRWEVPVTMDVSGPVRNFRSLSVSCYPLLQNPIPLAGGVYEGHHCPTAHPGHR